MIRLILVLAGVLVLSGGCLPAEHGDDDDNDDTGGGDDDGAGPRPVDVLWIVDSSNSMHDNQAYLAQAFGSFSTAMVITGSWVDYRMGVTTTQSRSCADDPTAFADCADSVGTSGRLRSLANTGIDTSHSPTFLEPLSPTLVQDFQALVDVGIDGATEEYGLWIVTEVLCASLDLDAAGNAPLAEFCALAPAGIEDYNIGEDGTRFLRDGAALLVVIVSDEGDYTTNMGDEGWPWAIGDCVLADPWPDSVQANCVDLPAVLCENFCKIEHFLGLFDDLSRDVVFAVLGPGAELTTDQLGNDTTEAFCNHQNSSIGMLEFYLWATEVTGGSYIPIDVLDGAYDCVDGDFEQAMRTLADLLIDVAGGG